MCVPVHEIQQNIFNITVFSQYSHLSISVGSTPVESTNHRLKIFMGKKILESYKKQNLSSFQATIYIAFTLCHR